MIKTKEPIKLGTGKRYAAYKVALYPTPEQEFLFEQAFEVSRQTYNLFLNLNEYLYWEKMKLSGITPDTKIIGRSRKITKARDFANNLINNFMNHDDCKSLYEITKELFPDKTHLGKFDMHKCITKFKKNNPEHIISNKKISGEIARDTVVNLDCGYQRFFKSPRDNGKPKIKRRFNIKSFGISSGVKSNPFFNDDTIFIPKMGNVPYRSKRKIPNGKIKTISVVKNANNHYYISLSIEYTNQPKWEINKFSKMVGIDSNLKQGSNFVLSNGESYSLDINKIKELEEYAKKQDRKYDRRKNNYKKDYAKLKHQLQKDGRIEEIPYFNFDSVSGIKKARITKAKAHRAIANYRKYWLNMFSTEIARKYDFVAVEKLEIKKMTKSGGNKKKAVNSSWQRTAINQFITLLKQKSEKYHCYVVEVQPANTSRICSECGKNNNAFGLNNNEWLKVREWGCDYCGSHHIRDINAAKNILNKGLETVQ